MENEIQVCGKAIKDTDYYGVVRRWNCDKPATHLDKSGVLRCRHHSHTGRYVVRNGAVGEIVARYDTEKELRDNISNFPGMRMQHLTKSHRRDII